MARRPSRIALAALGALLLPARGSAQSFWTIPDTGQSVAIEFLKPDFKNPAANSSGAVVTLSYRRPLGRRVMGLIELPFAHGAAGFGSGSETTIGNPYLGLDLGDPRGTSWVELGLRLPITPDDKYLASGTGIYTDIMRAEAFVPKLLSVTALGALRHQDPSSLRWRLRGGVILETSTSGSSSDRSDLWLAYGGQVGGRTGRLDLSGGFLGRILVTHAASSLGQRNITEAGIATTFDLGRFHPGIQLRVRSAAIFGMSWTSSWE